MEIVNHKEEIPLAHYQARFQASNPREIQERLPGAAFDGEAFSLTLLGKEYRITHPDGTVTAAEASEPPLPTQTFLLRYLLEGKEVSWGGGWKTFREMPWGEMYIKPYTGRVLTRAAFTFGTRLEVFRAACVKMGAVPVPHGDAGFLFDFLGSFQMQVLVWAGDEEFPPSAQVLYSDNFADGFAAEDRVVAGDILISIVKANL